LIWFIFAILAFATLACFVIGFSRRSPLLLFLAAFMLVFIALTLFSPGVSVPNGNTHSTIIGADENYPTVDSNILYTTYNEQNEPIIGFLAWLCLSIGLILAISGFILFST
jgi:hypothetical protein